MMDLPADKLVAAAATLGLLDQRASNQRGVAPLADRLIWGTLLRTFRSQLESVGLDFPIDHIDRMLSNFETSPGLTYETVRSDLEQLRFRIQDQLKRSSCLILTWEESRIYQKPLSGWEEVMARFPQTLGDIEEAQKCFALARYTATVFHSLQVVEAGLIELGNFIGVTDPKSGWTAVTGRLAKIMKTKWDERTPFERENTVFLEQVNGTIGPMKDAWRNKIDHVQGRLFVMSPNFNRPIADEILVAIRGFMRRLAAGLPSSR